MGQAYPLSGLSMKPADFTYRGFTNMAPKASQAQVFMLCRRFLDMP